MEQAGGGAETGYVLVIDGEGLKKGLPPQVSTPQATYGVHRARTELGQRHLLWQARGRSSPCRPRSWRGIRQAPDLLHDRRLLTELLIDACVGEQVRFRAPAELLAGWVARAAPLGRRRAAAGARGAAVAPLWDDSGPQRQNRVYFAC